VVSLVVLFLNKVIFIDSSAIGQLVWCTAICSLVFIVILLIICFFLSISWFRGLRRTAVQMPMLRGSRGWLFRFQKDHMR